MNAVLISLLIVAGSPEGSWPGFLGVGAGPISEKVPLSWSPEQGIAWQTALPGYGQSSPIVWGGTAFVTSVEGPMKEKNHVLAVKLNNGEVLWQRSFDSTDKVESTGYVSRAAPTPVTDGKSVFAFFESGDVVALALDGNELWKRSLPAEYGKFKTRHGLAASPLLTDKGIVFLVDHEGPSFLLCLNKGTGETLWKSDRKSRTSWSSPGLLKVGDREMIVCSSTGSVDGYDPATGEALWSFNDVGGNTSNTPLAFADGCFLVGASAGREAEAGGGKKSNLAIQVQHVDGKLTPSVLWASEAASSSFGSPIVYADNAYFVSRTGVLYCLDAQTGQERYTQRLKEPCWATPVGIGDRIYLFGKSGHTTVIATGAEFRILAESDLWKVDRNKAAEERPKTAEERPKNGDQKSSPAASSGPVLYGYALAGDRVIVRRGDRLYCIQEDR